MTLDDLLDDVSVLDPDQWENAVGPKGWYAVATADAGIVAYFHEEWAALSFRLSLIDRILNQPVMTIKVEVEGGVVQDVEAWLLGHEAFIRDEIIDNDCDEES